MIGDRLRALERVVELRVPYDRGDVLAGAAPRRRGARRGARGGRHPGAGPPPRSAVHRSLRRRSSSPAPVSRRHRPVACRARPGSSPPPYPHDRLDALRRLADAVPGGVVDCSIGTPVDPMPDVALRALADAAPRADRLPAVDRDARRCGKRRPRGSRAASASTVDRCRAWSRASAPRSSSPRCRTCSACATRRATPCSIPAISYPTYEMGAVLAGLRAVPVPLDDEWHLDLTRVSDDGRRRGAPALDQRARQPHGAGRGRERTAGARSTWARERGIIVASDECYAEFTGDRPPRRRPRCRAAATACSRSLAVEALEHGRACGSGFVAGDAELVGYLGETRKHAGLMVPTPIQAAAAAALGDDEHVAEQRDRYAARRRARARRARRRTASSTTAGPPLLPLAARRRVGRRRLGDRGAASPRPARSSRRATSTARPAPTTCASRSASPTTGSSSRSTGSPSRRTRAPDAHAEEEPDMSDLEKQITQLWEQPRRPRRGDAEAEAARRTCARRSTCSTRGEARVAEVVDDEVVVHQWLKQAILLLFRLQEMSAIEARPVRVPRQDPAEARLRGGRRAGRARRAGPLGRVPRARAS